METSDACLQHLKQMLTHSDWKFIHKDRMELQHLVVLAPRPLLPRKLNIHSLTTRQRVTLRNQPYREHRQQSGRARDNQTATVRSKYVR